MTIEGDQLIVRKELNIDPLLSAIPAYADMVNSQSARTGRRYAGSVDLLTAQNWAKECGAAIGTKEFRVYAKKKLNSPEFAKFRAPTKKLIF